MRQLHNVSSSQWVSLIIVVFCVFVVYKLYRDMITYRYKMLWSETVFARAKILAIMLLTVGQLYSFYADGSPTNMWLKVAVKLGIIVSISAGLIWRETLIKRYKV